jgi:hypothetical protein
MRDVGRCLWTSVDSRLQPPSTSRPPNFNSPFFRLLFFFFALRRGAYSNMTGNVLIVIVCPADISWVAPPYVPLKLL